MSDNLVIPQANPTTGIPVVPFSVGTTSKDIQVPPGSISLVNTINVVSAANSFTALSPTSRTSLANLISGYYDTYATGPSLFAYGVNPNKELHASSLLDAQVLYFTISAFPETITQYHTSKDGHIDIGFNYPNTFQRSVNGWSTATPDGSFTISVNGASSTVINGSPYSVPTLRLISNASNGIYDVQVKDNFSGFYLNTTVTIGYGGATNVYIRCPNRINTNGTWSNNSSQGYS
jgi:hypothetical protein